MSDVHSNMASLSKALEYLAHYGVNQILSLGDVVGYGPDPKACLALVRSTCSMVTQGNHDAAISDESEYRRMSRLAKAGVDYARARLSDEEKMYLSQLPRVLTLDNMTLVHGSLTADKFDYILDANAASENFMEMTTNLLFVGHSHMAFVSDRLADGEETMKKPCFYAFADEGAVAVRLRDDQRYIINPGSVGQPRDIPLGSFCMYDTEDRMLTFVRYPYDIEKVKRRIVEAGLPEMAWQRLYQTS